MSEYPEGEFALPLFPLPSLVFFPQTRLPLHIFEPRYRVMLADALASDKRIGMVLLRPGWESNYYGSPAVYDFGTVGEIEQAVKLDDGRYNILLRGTVRYRVLGAISESPYRSARVVADPEVRPDPMEAYAAREWLADLARRYIEFMPGQMQVPELDTVSLDALANALVMTLDLAPERKQILLEAPSLGWRAEEVGKELHRRIEELQMLSKFRRGGDPREN